MIPYAAVTRTRRNLEALRRAGWRMFLTPDEPKPPQGFRYAIDNGAWRCYQKQIPFDERRFERLYEERGKDADFVVLPDIVCGGLESLRLSEKWIERLPGVRLLLPLQDGMTPADSGCGDCSKCRRTAYMRAWRARQKEDLPEVRRMVQLDALYRSEVLRGSKG